MENLENVESNSIFCVRKIRNHALGTNVFMFGSQTAQVQVLEFDPTAKFDSWYFESQGKF